VEGLRTAQDGGERLHVTRATLLSGCWAVSEHPAVCVWKRIFQDRGFFAPNRSRMTCAQILRAARSLAISSKKSLCALKKYDKRGAKSSTSSPRPARPRRRRSRRPA
jgi:hypothetical protein